MLILYGIYWRYLKGRTLSLKLLSSCLCTEIAQGIGICLCLSPSSMLYLSPPLAIKGLDWGSDIPLTAGIIFVLDLEVQSLPLVPTTSFFAGFVVAVFFCYSSTWELFHLLPFIWALVSVPLWQKILCVQLFLICICNAELIVAPFILLSSAVIWGTCGHELKTSEDSAVKQSKVVQGFTYYQLNYPCILSQYSQMKCGLLGYSKEEFVV